MENILIIDTETTGLSPEKGAKLIEIGALLYNVKHKVVLQSFSTLLPCGTNEAEHINGIKPEWTQINVEQKLGYMNLTNMYAHSKCFVAHNSAFDRKFIEAYGFIAADWICTQKDFQWPVELFRHRLQDICEAMGVPYVNAHRALNDCNLLAECLSNVDDLQERLIQAKQRADRSLVTFR